MSLRGEHLLDLTFLFRHCTLYGRLLSLKQDSTHLHYRVMWPKAVVAPPTPPSSTSLSKGGSVATGTAASDDTEALLKNYFNLDHDLTLLYEQWAVADPNFRKRAPKFAGVRILNQDAWEALICFICSSNNNISRISQMVSCATPQENPIAQVNSYPPSGPQALPSLWPVDWQNWR